MKLELSDKICPFCNEHWYVGEWSHCCSSIPTSRGIECTDCQKTIILYGKENMSKSEFWNKYFTICQCEHEMNVVISEETTSHNISSN